MPRGKMHFILCDEINSGKSTFILDLCSDLINHGFSISGWITPPHLEGSVKTGHDIIFSDEGVMRSPIPFTRLEPFERSFQWRRYHFNENAFEMANHLDTGCDLFVMDEIGPLELEEKNGFFEIMNRAIGSSDNTLIVIRDGLKPLMSEVMKGLHHSFETLRSKTELRNQIESRLSHG